jgi:3-hydroxyisobutyrate dehydrogenase-like beta-hydroxyacid dehydrogenase
VLGRRSGLDVELLYKVIRDGAGTSRMFEVRAPLMMRRDYADATMKVDVYQKDIDIISAYATGLHCPTPLFDASKAFYSAAYAQGHAKDDTAAICAVLERMAATEGPAERRKKGSRSSARARIARRR